jgi:phosphoglycerate dehydrogenase-like enzyme
MEAGVVSAMKRIVVAVDGITPEQKQQIVKDLEDWATVDFISGQPADWEQSLAGAEVVFGWPTPAALERSGVRLFQLPSVGYEQYMTATLTAKRGFWLANARGVTANAVAEHCLSMIFAFARQVPLHVRQQQQHTWKRSDRYSLLAGSTVAVIGLGTIGSTLAERCHALGMRVVGVRRSHNAPAYVSELYRLDELHQALRNANHVALTIAALAQDTPLFGSEEFNAMPRGSYFYNVSRGSLVSAEALKLALRNGRLAGAGLDVFSDEPLSETDSFWDCENVLISPHAGGRFEGEIAALVDLFSKNLRNYRVGSPMTNLVISNP